MKIINVIRIFIAIKFVSLRDYLLTKKEQEKLIMAEFRSLSLLFGFDTSKFSDEEIKDNVTNALKEMSKTGLNVSEASERLRRMVY